LSERERAAPADPVLSVRDLSVRYAAGALAVREANLTVGRGEVVLVVGPNGAGKTSLVRGICGFASYEGVRRRGSVEFEGRPILGQDPAVIARAGITFIPERDKVFRALTVAENLKTFAQRRRGGATDEAVEQVYDTFPWLRERRKALAGYLSGGEQQQLALASALLVRPTLLVIDEPSLGLAPVKVREIVALLTRLREQLRASLLIVDQNVKATAALADRVHVMDAGHLGDAEARGLYQAVRS
jgi:branched-chain amino acid transport system ATP-binding protein